MFHRISIWLVSQSWFWTLRSKLGKFNFFFEANGYKFNIFFSRKIGTTKILIDIILIGGRGLFWALLWLTALIVSEDYVRNNTNFLQSLEESDNDFYIEQLRLYAQVLTVIFSIYFATIGIILSAGYTRFRRDIIQLLTIEQVGSVYSNFLVFTVIFCLSAMSARLIEFQSGLFVYVFGTILTIFSSLALFPLGLRLFNFFDPIPLVSVEIIPNFKRHVKGATNPKSSDSVINHHSKKARSTLEQFNYIDDHIKKERERLNDNLPELSEFYSKLLLYYLQQKNKINPESYWYPRRQTHKEWFFADEDAISLALQTRSSQWMVEEKIDYQWFENEISERIANHIDLAFEVGDLDLVYRLITQFSIRIPTYAKQFHFYVGLQEIIRMNELIQKAFASKKFGTNDKETKLMIGIADVWVKQGSNLCLEMLQRIISFEKELKQFFEADVWTEKSLRRLPAFLQGEFSFIVERINFERDIEGSRLSKPKYIQQLAVQILLQQYAKILSEVCDFHVNQVPNFVDSLAKMNLPEAATQVVLDSLHNYWKLPRWFNEFSQLLDRYSEYMHYSEEKYKFPEIDIADMKEQLASANNKAIAMLGNKDIVGHILVEKHNDELPDHFGQIYFELAEACINSLQQNNEKSLEEVLPMFLALVFLAAHENFLDPSLDLQDEYRVNLMSAVINDLASVLGLAILYGAYFDNTNLSELAINRFDAWIENFSDKQHYLRGMVQLTDSPIFLSILPWGTIRSGWNMSFKRLARRDGFSYKIGMDRGKPHQNKIVREFLGSEADASQLFFAYHIVPQLNSFDIEIGYQISDLARRLHEEG
ncbi:MAG: hypothetical protein OXF46_09840 [Rhodobacteraceae bacterium]|nr:hypothetical protein [Paracoccaceae bacterium]